MRRSPVTSGLVLGVVVGILAIVVLAVSQPTGEERGTKLAPGEVARLAGVFGIHGQVAADSGGWVVRDGNRLLRVNRTVRHPWFLVQFGGPCQLVPGEPATQERLPPLTGPPTDCPDGSRVPSTAAPLGSRDEAVSIAAQALRQAGLGQAVFEATPGTLSWHVGARPLTDQAERWTASIDGDGNIVDASGFLDGRA